MSRKNRRRFPMFLIIFVSSISFFSLCPEGYADNGEVNVKSALSERLRLPRELITELVATIEALRNLGVIRRFESIYYHEHVRYVSEGLRRWGEPFTNLLMDPNASESRKWDYRIRAHRYGFKAIARRKSGKYEGHQIRFDHNGDWSGDYPFWPLSNLPSLPEKVKEFFED